MNSSFNGSKKIVQAETQQQDQSKKKRSSFVITQYIPKPEREIQSITNGFPCPNSSNNNSGATNKTVSTNYNKNKRIYSTKKLFNERKDVLSLDCTASSLPYTEEILSPTKKMKLSPTTPTNSTCIQPYFHFNKFHSEQFTVERPILLPPSSFPVSSKESSSKESVTTPLSQNTCITTPQISHQED